MFLLVPAFDRLLATRESGSWRDALIAGGLLGLATLVRSGTISVEEARLRATHPEELESHLED